MAVKTKSVQVPANKTARYVTTACARCGVRIEVGSVVEPLPVAEGSWYRWVHKGCDFKAPYNCLDSDGNPSIDGNLKAKSKASGIENSIAPPPKSGGKGDSTPPPAEEGLGESLAKGVAQAIYDGLKAEDDYWDKKPGGEEQDGEANGKASKGAANGKGKVKIPQHSPELEDWVRVVVRDELSEVLPKVLKPMIDEVGSRFNKMEHSMQAFCKDVNDWRDGQSKYFKEQIDEMLKLAGEVQVQKHTYTINNKPAGTETLFEPDVVHEIFPKVLDLATCSPREHIFVAGPSGSGKSFLAGQVATALGVPFGYMSCSGGINESHLLGRTIPNVQTGEAMFITSEFVKRYEEGGMFLLDEIDAADPNVLIVLNNALANGMLAIPARIANPYAKKHDDFICMVAANTFGRGSSRMYVGRNQLDEATLDRFRIGMLTMDYSPKIEKMLCPVKSTYEMMLNWRKQIEAAGMRRVLSTRFMAQAHRMMTQKGWTKQNVYEALTTGWSPDEKAKVKL